MSVSVGEMGVAAEDHNGKCDGSGAIGVVACDNEHQALYRDSDLC